MEATVETDIEETLTHRQARFVYEYLKDQNASAAAVRAGYSEKTRASQANELMKNPAVAERIRLEMADMLAQLKSSALDLMRERMRAAFFRAGKLFDAQGRVLRPGEMEQETRDSLVISVEWRHDEPILRVKMPSREKALSALEKVHEKLDRLNEKQMERAAREAAAPVHAAPVVAGWPGLRLTEPEQAPEPVATEQAPVATASAVVSDAADSASASIEKPPGFSGSNTDVVAEVPPATEKPQVFSGSPATTVVDAATPAAPVVEASTAAVPADAAPARGELNPGAPLIKRRDADLMWGGKRGPTPAAEPSPALQEHLARVRHAELADEVRRDMEARGGRIKPGPLRPQGLPPGYNPPWLRDDRPQFAIGAGECSLDD